MSDILVGENQISVYQGESATITIKITDSLNKYVDLTGATVYFTVKINEKDPAHIVQKISTSGSQILVTKPREGTAEIYISSTDTITLNSGVYVYDLWVMLATGKKHPAIKPSVFELKESVTKFI